MPTPDPGAYGVSLNVSPDGRHREEAAEVERLGYGAIWISGGQLDTLDRLGEVAGATGRVVVAPGVLAVDHYDDPAVLARLYAGLEAAAPGRFLLGLGGPHGPKPLAGLNAYLDRLDAAAPPVPAERRVLAALGPRKLELARDRAAGAVPIAVTPAYTTQARRALGPGRLLAVDQLVVLDGDAGRARATARTTLGFLAGVPGSTASLTRMGFTAEQAAGITDDVVDGVVAHGDEAAVAARLRAYRDAGADHVALHVLAADGQPGPFEVARRLAPHLLG